MANPPLIRQPGGYSLKHLSAHLLAAGPQRYPKLYRLVSRDWLDARLQSEGALYGFSTDLEYAIAASLEEGLPSLHKLIEFSILTATLRRFSSNLSPVAVKAVAEIRGFGPALEFVSLMLSPYSRGEASVRIARVALERERLDEMKIFLEHAENAASACFPRLRCELRAQMAPLWHKLDLGRCADHIHAALTEAECLDVPEQRALAMAFVAEAQAAVGMTLDQEIMNKILQRGRDPNLAWGDSPLECRAALLVLKVLWRAGQQARILAYIDSLTLPTARAFARATLAEMVRDFDVDWALDLLERARSEIAAVSDLGAKTYSWIEVTRVLAPLDPDAALDLLHSTVAAWKNTGWGQLIDEAWSTVIAALAAKGRISEAYQEVEKLKVSSSFELAECQALAVMATAVANIDPVAAEAALVRALKEALRPRDRTAKPMALAALATGLARQDQTEEALQLARSIEWWLARAKSLAAVVNRLVEQGRIEEAKPLLDEIQAVDESHHAESARIVAEHLAGKKHLEDARKIVERITNESLRARALGAVAAVAARNDAGQFQLLLDHLLSEREGLDPEADLDSERAWSEAETLADLAGSLSTVAPELSEKLLSRALMLYGDGMKRIDALAGQARRLIVCRSPEKALPYVEALRTYGEPGSALRAYSDTETDQILIEVIDALAGRNLDTARSLIDRLKYSDARVQALGLLGAELMRKRVPKGSWLLAQAVALAKGIEYPEIRFRVCIFLAGRTPEAALTARHELLTLAMSAAEDLPCDDYDRYDPRTLAKARLLEQSAALSDERTLSWLQSLFVSCAGQGRDDAYRALEEVVPALTRYGGTDLLRRIHRSLMEIESWWEG